MFLQNFPSLPLNVETLLITSGTVSSRGVEGEEGLENACCARILPPKRAQLNFASLNEHFNKSL